MIESRFSTDRRVLFREVFTPDSIARNGGVITGGVALENGVATFDGTGNNKILYAGSNWGQSTEASFRLKTPSLDGSSNMVLLGTTYTDIEIQVRPTEVTLYLGVINVVHWQDRSITHNIADLSKPHDFVITISGNVFTLYVDGVSQGQTTFVSDWTRHAGGTVWEPCLGLRNVSSNIPLIGELELVEIYDGALTPEEVSLLNDNKLYTGPITDNLVLYADYTTGSSRNLAREYSDTVVTNGAFNDWTLPTYPDGWAISGAPPDSYLEEIDGACRIYSNGVFVTLRQIKSFTNGKTYRVCFDTKIKSGGYKVRTSSNSLNEAGPDVGSHIYIFVADGTETYIEFKNNGACDIIVDNISVQEVLGASDTDITYKHGLGAEFDGASSEINYGNPNILQITGQLTMEMVVRCNKTGTNYEVFCGKWVGADACYMIQYFEGNQTPSFYIWKSGVNNNVLFNSMADGNLHHLIAVNDGTDLKTYFDGIHAVTNVGGGGIIDNDPANFAIGSRAGGGRYTDGFIKYVRIYKGKAFSALEARQNYQAAMDGGYLNG